MTVYHTQESKAHHMRTENRAPDGPQHDSKGEGCVGWRSRRSEGTTWSNHEVCQRDRQNPLCQKTRDYQRQAARRDL